MPTAERPASVITRVVREPSSCVSHIYSSGCAGREAINFFVGSPRRTMVCVPRLTRMDFGSGKTRPLSRAPAAEKCSREK